MGDPLVAKHRGRAGGALPEQLAQPAVRPPADHRTAAENLAGGVDPLSPHHPVGAGGDLGHHLSPDGSRAVGRDLPVDGGAVRRGEDGSPWERAGHRRRLPHRGNRRRLGMGPPGGGRADAALCDHDRPAAGAAGRVRAAHPMGCNRIGTGGLACARHARAAGGAHSLFPGGERTVCRGGGRSLLPRAAARDPGAPSPPRRNGPGAGGAGAPGGGSGRPAFAGRPDPGREAFGGLRAALYAGGGLPDGVPRGERGGGGLGAAGGALSGAGMCPGRGRAAGAYVQRRPGGVGCGQPADWVRPALRHPRLRGAARAGTGPPPGNGRAGQPAGDRGGAESTGAICQPRHGADRRRGGGGTRPFAAHRRSLLHPEGAARFRLAGGRPGAAAGTGGEAPSPLSAGDGV